MGRLKTDAEKQADYRARKSERLAELEETEKAFRNLYNAIHSYYRSQGIEIPGPTASRKENALARWFINRQWHKDTGQEADDPVTLHGQVTLKPGQEVE